MLSTMRLHVDRMEDRPMIRAKVDTQVLYAVRALLVQIPFENARGLIRASEAIATTDLQLSRPRCPGAHPGSMESANVPL